MWAELLTAVNLLIKYHYSYQDISGTLSRMGEKEKCIQGFGEETGRKETNWKTQV
jgi:hypothetical protein